MGMKKIKPAVDVRYQGPPFENPDLPPPAPLPDDVEDPNEKQAEKVPELDEDEVNLLLSFQEFEANPHSFLVGQKFVISLNYIATLGKPKHDEFTSLSGLNTSLKAIYQKLPVFKTILESPARSEFPVRPQNPVLGQSRLRMVELFSILVDLRLHIFDMKMVEYNVIQTCLNLFFQYPNNNFLHHAVQNMIVAILRGGCSLLRSNLFEKANLVNRILDAFDENDRTSIMPRGTHRPYMGHLIRVSNAIQKSSFIQSFVKEHLEKNTRWKIFCASKLVAINERESRVLGGFMPSRPVEQVTVLRSSIAEFPSDPFVAQS